MCAKRVVCAISGGIDSAVSALLLKKKGFDVTGLFMVNWDHAEEGAAKCSRIRDLEDAERICKHLQIPLHSVDFVREYWNDVFVPFLEGYKRGRFVVPDVACNSFIKFGRFFDYALKNFNADYVATGHYARTSYGDFLENVTNDTVKLLRAKDPIKDQTYFLASVPNESLARTMFPVGSLSKSKVKLIARDAGLDFLLKKKESMGICFIGKRKDFDNFLHHYIDPKPGKIVLEGTGTIIGEHDGIHHFTLGKRVAVPTQNYRSHDGLFVSGVDMPSGVVRVCEGSYHPSLFATAFRVSSPFWRNETTVTKLRFALQRHQPPLACKLNSDNLVLPSRPIRAAVPGQYCVFYSGDVCLGGGEVDYVAQSLE